MLRPQFTFGIQMGKLTQLFDTLSEAKLPTIEDGDVLSKKFNFFGSEELKTKDFLSGMKDRRFPDPVKNAMTSVSKTPLDVSADLKGFLSYLGYYIGRMSQKDPDIERAYIENPRRYLILLKTWFTFMNRSGFDNMYKSLKPEDKAWFKDNKLIIIKSVGKNPEDQLFTTEYTYESKNESGVPSGHGRSHGPTILEWFNSIIDSDTSPKRDALSPPKEFLMGGSIPDPEQAMGRLNKMDTSSIPKYATDIEQKDEVKLVVIELRDWGDYIEPDEWKDHTYDMAVIYSLISGGDLDSNYIRDYYRKLKKLEACRDSYIRLLGDEKYQGNLDYGGIKLLKDYLSKIYADIAELKAMYGQPRVI